MAGIPYPEKLGDPGQYPYTRGLYPDMYRKRHWTMRQYAGYSSAAESNRRYRYLLSQGTTGLSVAFDLPTQIGYDSDSPLARGEVGRVGVAIDSIEDMRLLFDGIPLDRVTTSMTINATAAILLSLYLVVAEEQGVSWEKVGGHGPERHPQGVRRARHLHLPAEAVAQAGDRHHRLLRRAGAEVEHDLDLRLPHARGGLDGGAGGGLHPRQRPGLRAGGARPGLERSTSSRRASPSSSTPTTTSSRRWRSSAPPAGCGPSSSGSASAPKDPRSLWLRFHTQTAGSTLTAQQPQNNVVRVAIQALAAVCGGTQSLHTNSLDEALGLPTEEAARLALRTQQVIANESGVADVADPLGGSYVVEAWTEEIVQRSRDYIRRIDEMGGALAGLERGFQQKEIADAAYLYQMAVEEKREIVVGVNAYASEEETADGGPADRSRGRARAGGAAPRRARAARSGARRHAVRDLAAAAREDRNLMPAILDCGARRGHARGDLGRLAGGLRGVPGGGAGVGDPGFGSSVLSGPKNQAPRPPGLGEDRGSPEAALPARFPHPCPEAYNPAAQIKTKGACRRRTEAWRPPEPSCGAEPSTCPGAPVHGSCCSPPPRTPGVRPTWCSRSSRRRSFCARRWRRSPGSGRTLCASAARR